MNSDELYLTRRAAELRKEVAEGSLESAYALKQLPTLENLIQHVNDYPGQQRVGTWWKPWQVFIKPDKPEYAIEIRLWKRVEKQALQQKLLQRDWRGHLWPYGKKPTAKQAFLEAWNYWLAMKIVAITGMAVICLMGSLAFHTMVHFGVSEILATNIKLWLMLPILTVWTINRWDA